MFAKKLNMSEFIIKQFELRFTIDENTTLSQGDGVCIGKKVPETKEDFFWVERVDYEGFGFTYKLFGDDRKYLANELSLLRPVIVSKECLDYYEIFYHNGKLYECYDMKNNENDDWVIVSESLDEFLEKDVLKVIALPTQIGWVYNEGPPHDHNYNWVDSRYLEVLHPNMVIEWVRDGMRVTIVMEEICTNGKLSDCVGDYKLVASFYDGKVIIDGYNLLRKSKSTMIYK